MANQRARLTGRRTKGRFAILPRDLIQHPAVTTLHAAVRWLVVAFADQYNGKNNGALCMTLDIAREYGIASRDTLRRALRELERRQLILRTDPGSYIPPRPARYAITWQPIDATTYTTTSRTATHAYRECDHVAAA